DLKQVVKSLLEEANNRPFQKREGCRKSLFHEVEKAALKPLPNKPYQYAIWKKAKVNIDYHVEFEGNYYSTPYQLVKQPVEIRATYSTVEIIHKGKRVSSFPRQQANKHIWKTEPEHMPPNHQKVTEWTPERITKWASSIGPYTSSLVTRIMASKEHPELGYRSCMGIIRLAKVYSPQRVENASKRALAYGATSYHSMVSILEKGLDHLDIEEEADVPPILHENIRGMKYFSKEVN
ncbi:MAG: transposase, partial [Firmicutes bacterium]|nr:transposase [Bacillota bacterium]